MKWIPRVSVVLVCALPVIAQAECTNQRRVTGKAFSNLVQCGSITCNTNSGSTVCAMRGNDRWQSQHHPGGDLWDYKRGPGDPMDPSKKVGNWKTQGNSITYEYAGGHRYTYSIHTNSAGGYDFCESPNGGVASISNAVFKPGLTGCP